MRVITAPDACEVHKEEITCFLAGGITGCHGWQQRVINSLAAEFSAEPLVIFNPRREVYPGGDEAMKTQIKWEFDHLEQADIFSMYFTGGPSDQPICMYELGRNLLKMSQKFPGKTQTVISVEYGYKRKDDVIIQSGLTGCPLLLNAGADVTPELHAESIKKLYKTLRGI